MMSASPIQPATGLILDDDALDSAAAKLRELDEATFLTTIVQPYFERRGEHVENVHNRGEQRHGLDLLIRIRRGNHEILEGVQTKARESLTTPTQVRDEIAYKYKRALDYKHPGPGGTTLRLNLLYWITTGDVNSQGREGVRIHIDEDQDLASRIVVWDARRLIQELVAANCHDLLRSLELARYQAAKRQHLEQGEGVFAAHCAYLAACWYLESAEPANVENARECLQEAVGLIDGDPRRAAYYYRTLREFYLALRNLLGAFPGAWGTTGLLRTPEITEYLNQNSSRGDTFLYTTYYAMRQMRQLEKQHVALPIGLTSLQICNLLLRMGWSPILSTNVAKRIDDAAAEMNEARHPSIHNKCSLCTSPAVSCFTLANLERVRKHCADALGWLRRLRNDRYCYHPGSFGEVPPGRHALHYAANVLIAFCDDAVFRGADMRKLDGIVAIFFNDLSTTDHGFYSEWMRYRNISEFEVCAYVFKGFLRFLLAGGTLKKSHRNALKKALINLMERLEVEGIDTPGSWRLYVVRENVASLRLGMLLGVSECAEVLQKVTDGWHKDLCNIYDTTEVAPVLPSNVERVKAERLLESNSGRLCVFLESLVQQWEGEILSRSHEEGSPAVAIP